MLRKKIQSLVLVSKQLQAKKKEILEYWVGSDTVIDILQKHEIDLELFKNEYASNILEYYFSIVNQEKEIKDCPTMFDFLDMLKEHDISADELFDICTHARKSMVSVTFDMGIARKELFQDISYVFDLSFKSVLQYYSNTVYRLEKEVQTHIQENKKKDALMLQQARLAQMGGMISNIAHQWRQPITMISAIIQNTHMKYSLGKLEADVFNKNVEEIKRISEQMSQTIRDFQNFFEPNKEKERFCVEEAITKALEFIKYDFKHENIDVFLLHHEKEEDVLGYPNEFYQALVNIFSNAKDALMKNNDIENRTLKIQSERVEDKIVLTIEDNAGGIEEDLLEKVFNPYFTTKEQGKGTGIGLYMSSQIITNMNGILHVENSEIYENRRGAMFIIELPVY